MTVMGMALFPTYAMQVQASACVKRTSLDLVVIAVERERPVFSRPVNRAGNALTRGAPNWIAFATELTI